MKCFKKAVISTAVVLFLSAFMSAFLLATLFNSEYRYFYDLKLRNNLAGSIDFIAIGDSYAVDGFDTAILDSNLNCFSYDLAGIGISWRGIKELLDEELERNPIKTAVICISPTSFTESHDDLVGEEYLIPRINSFSKKASYYFEKYDLNNSTKLFGRLLYESLFYNFSRIINLKLEISNVDYTKKGYNPNVPLDVTLENEEIAENLNIYTFEKDEYREDYIAMFEKTVNELKAKNIRIIVVTLPTSNTYIWQNAGFDHYREFACSLKDKYGYEYYDFNLQKTRYSLYSDENSFKDTHHLCKNGAETFTEQFCCIIIDVDSGKDVSDDFYESYEEMKKDSPYMQYYLSQKGE